MHLKDMVFPVYYVGSQEPIIEQGVSFYLLGKDINYSDAQYIVRVLDDKNIPGTTLAQRRLALVVKGVTLLPLRKAIFFVGDFLKIVKSHDWYIDSSGQLFKYSKSTTVPLMYFKIKDILNVPTGGSIISIEGIPNRFKTLLNVRDSYAYKPEYAGLLKLGMSYILYGLYDTKYRNTVRRI